MMEKAGFEIDILPVGNGNRSGDAIAIRYGVLGNYKILVYDGGTKESGQALVDHILKYYATAYVDFVVSSHPDIDHTSGLSVIFEYLEVGELWMHRPWNYSHIILDYFRDGRITNRSLAERLKEKMAAAYSLEQLAGDYGIPVYEPFQGASIGSFTVMSPNKNWFVHDLIAEFQKSPEQIKLEAASLKGIGGLIGKVTEASAKALAWVAEQWGSENLRNDVTTSAENESSVVLFGQIDGKGILLTGDAGIRALNNTAAFAESQNFSLPINIHYIQVPHHGSRHNVSTNSLDRILGSRKILDDGQINKYAFVSVSKESITHPRRAVVNAFIRRGVKVIATKGQTKRYSHNMPDRAGWVPATPLGFSNQVEAWD